MEKVCFAPCMDYFAALATHIAGEDRHTHGAGSADLVFAEAGGSPGFNPPPEKPFNPLAGGLTVRPRAFRLLAAGRAPCLQRLTAARARAADQRPAHIPPAARAGGAGLRRGRVQLQPVPGHVRLQRAGHPAGRLHPLRVPELLRQPRRAIRGHPGECCGVPAHVSSHGAVRMCLELQPALCRHAWFSHLCMLN